MFAFHIRTCLLLLCLPLDFRREKKKWSTEMKERKGKERCSQSDYLVQKETAEMKPKEACLCTTPTDPHVQSQA